jgi:hypothetical protein
MIASYQPVSCTERPGIVFGRFGRQAGGRQPLTWLMLLSAALVDYDQQRQV